MLKRTKLSVPEYVQATLDKYQLWDAYSQRPAYQRNDYIWWITSAKRETTRNKRLQQMISELQQRWYVHENAPSSVSEEIRILTNTQPCELVYSTNAILAALLRCFQTSHITVLKVGRKAPSFSLLDQRESKHTLKQYRGQWVLIYFYPKDDTPGCTKEACTIAEVYGDFKRRKVVVLGVSKDTPRSHQKFAEKYNLPFTLLSDPDMTIIEKYGAYKEKKMFGKSVRGTLRISYVINPDGVIAKVYPAVDPANHAAELLNDIKVLQKTFVAG